jgi:hypothetical protein
MRRLLAAGLFGFATLSAGWLALCVPSPAAPNGDAPAPKLPFRRIVLFSSGVGFFQREGEVDGDARVDLAFPAGEVNDLLKSLTVQDLGGGRVQAVGYDSHDPVERTLKSFAIDLSDNPGQGQLLDRARGERVEVTPAAGPPLTGTIVGVERAEQVHKEARVVVESLTLLTGDGLRSVRLSDVQRVRFLNPALESELQRALETLSRTRDSKKKSVSFRFAGAGKRTVRVSYVVEHPIWKTSYRLVLAADGKPFLQGWAVVENPSDEDWSGVRMALVSGRPISFRMDLYTPLYVPRPVVEPELFASLRPPTYGGAMGDKLGAVVHEPRPAAPTAGRAALERRAERAKVGQADAGAASQFAEAGEQVRLDLASGVVAAATGAQLGDVFQYTLEDPISVARQKSSMLPIVNKEVEGRRVSIFNVNTHVKHPLLGLRFKNSTGLSLMQGPVTVFEGASYAGDARLPDLQAGEERLVAFAVDLGTEVESQVHAPPQQYGTLKIVKGILTATRKLREEKSYKAVNRSGAERVLLLEHPYRAEYKLVSAVKPAERTRDQYRFELKLPAGGSAALDVAEERDLEQAVQLVTTNDEQIRFYLRLPAITPAVRAALEQAIDLRTKLAAAQRDLQGVANQLAEIAKDQERMRANIKELPAGSAVRTRLVEKFDQQETQIEKLQGDQKRLREAEAATRVRYEQFLTNLTVS